VHDLDVVGIGNALVDVITHADDAFIAKHGLNKGAMTLIDTERAVTLYGAMGRGVEMSGGSAANTMTGIASFGGRAAYIGKIGHDELGSVFGHDLRAEGVVFGAAQCDAGNAHRAVPDHRHARRAAHHEHLPGRLGSARAR
jgi:sugar/nucleoside kinase (ribokinase family)